MLVYSHCRRRTVSNGNGLSWRKCEKTGTRIRNNNTINCARGNSSAVKIHVFNGASRSVCEGRKAHRNKPCSETANSCVVCRSVTKRSCNISTAKRNKTNPPIETIHTKRCVLIKFNDSFESIRLHNHSSVNNGRD